MLEVSFNDCVRERRFVNSNISHRLRSCPTIRTQQEAKNLFHFPKNLSISDSKDEPTQFCETETRRRGWFERRKDNKLRNKEAEGSL